MLHVRREILRKNNGKSRFFHHSRSLNRSFLALCWIFYGGVVKIAIYLYLGTLWWKKNFEWNIFFGHWAKFLQPSGKIFFIGLCLNCLLLVQKYIFRKTFFGKKFLIHHFGMSSETFFVESLRRVKKTRFFVCVGKI